MSVGELLFAVPFVPALFFLFKISHNTGRLVEKIDGHEKRLQNIEKKVFS